MFVLLHVFGFIGLLLDAHLSQGLLHQVVPVGQLLCPLSLEVGRDGNLDLVRRDLHVPQHVVNEGELYEVQVDQLMLRTLLFKITRTK